jgi:cell division septal protein FtsQ
MSYRKSHVKTKINKIKPKKSIFKKLWFWLAILFMVIFLTSGYFALFYSGLQVKNIEISGNSKIQTQDLQNFVSDFATTGLIKFWKINITSKSILLLDTDNLNKKILEKFLIINKVNINKKYPQTLTLGVTERNPVGVFCGQDNKCFLVDENGIAYEPASRDLQDKTIVRQIANNGQVFTGKQVTEKNTMAAIYKIQKDLKDNFQINLDEALVTSPIRLNVKTGESWQIYFDTDEDSDIRAQLTKLNILLAGKLSQPSRKSLRYIDLRPKDRAIVCDNNTCGE